MSYSCSDFVNDCEGNAAHYKLPELTAEHLEVTGIEPDPAARGDSDGLRYLAERVARAMAERQELLAALGRKHNERRERIATAALSGLIANKARPGHWLPDEDAAYCVQIADSLIKELDK